jgi:ATP synthase protein I
MDAPEQKDPHPGRSGRWSREFGPYLTLGLQLALSVVVCFFVGRWLDGWLGTSPWLMIAGLALGIVGGFLQFFRTVIGLGKVEDEKAEQQRKRYERES